MKNVPVFLCVLATLVFAAAACNEKKENREDDEVVIRERQELRKEINDAKRRVDVRIVELRADIDTVTTDVKTELEQQINKLEKASRDLDDKAKDLESDVERDWEEFKADIRKAIAELDREINVRIDLYDDPNDPND